MTTGEEATTDDLAEAAPTLADPTEPLAHPAEHLAGPTVPTNGNGSAPSDPAGGSDPTDPSDVPGDDLGAELRRLDREVYAAKTAVPLDAERLQAVRAARRALLELAAAATPSPAGSDAIPAAVLLISGLRDEAAIL